MANPFRGVINVDIRDSEPLSDDEKRLSTKGAS